MSEEKTEAEITADMKLAVEGEQTPEELEAGEEAPEVEEPSEVEQQAVSMGWNPDGVDGKRNISAEEFVERSSLFDRIHKLEKQSKTNDKVIDALKKYNETISDKEYERAIHSLKQQKFQALEENDNVRVLELDDEIEKTRAEKPQPVQEEEQPAYSPEEWQTGMQSFAKDNFWYGRRPEMSTFADQLGVSHSEKNPDISPAELFAFVQAEVKTKYSDFFEESPKPNKVAGAGRRAPGATDKKSLKDIPEEDRDIALTLIRTGTISEEDYIKSYFG